jgi:hypothetical protein
VTTYALKIIAVNKSGHIIGGTKNSKNNSKYQMATYMLKIIAVNKSGHITWDKEH